MSCKTFTAGLQSATLIGLAGGWGTGGLSREAAHSEGKGKAGSSHTGLREQRLSLRERYLSALSEEAQVPLHHMQLPVVVLQASGEDSRAQGSEGTDRVMSLPSVTPLKPPDRKSWPSQLVIASETERFTGSPTAEAEGEESKMIWSGLGRL